MKIDNYSLADIRAATNGSDGCGFDGFGGGGAWVMIILFALIFGWGGNGFGNRTGGEPVTEAGLCNSMNFNNLENAVGRLSDTVQAGQRQTDNAVCQLGYQSLQNTNSIQRDLSTGFAQQAQCCCDTLRAIDGVNYNGAMNTAAINANTTAGIQKVLDKMCENETNALRARVQQLELQSSLCGVVRYPTATTYGAGFNPFFSSGCGCGCGGNI